MKNIIYIAPTSFPPNLISGSIRNTKTVKYLYRKGWKATVLTTPLAFQKTKASTLSSELPGDIVVHEIPIPFFGLKSKINYSLEQKNVHQNAPKKKIIRLWIKKVKSFLFGLLRNLFLIPDDVILWKRQVMKFIRKNLKIEDFDLIISSAPPFSAHRIGMYIAKKYNIPFVPDFRDPWMGHIAFNPRNWYRQAIEKKIEKNIIRLARFIPCATIPMVTDFVKAHPKLETKFITIENGFDREDFGNQNIQKNGDILHIVYTGSFGRNYNPTDFFEQLKKFLETKPEAFGKIKVSFAGKMVEDFSNYFNDELLSKVLEYKGELKHKNVIELIQTADVLLLILFAHTTGYTIMSNKLYEYIGAQKPIFAIIPEGIARKTIEQYDLGYCAHPGDKAKIFSIIVDIYEKHLNGNLKVLNKPNEIFTREFQVNKYVNLLNSLIK